MLKAISILFSLVLCTVLIFGCGLSDDEDRGKAPTIGAVYFYKDGSSIPTSNFNVGDTVSFEVRFEDPDLDAMTLHVAIYDLGNPDTIYDGPTVYELDAEQRSDNSISEEFDVAFQAGEYRVDFQVVDEKANPSLIFRKKIYFL